MSKQIQVFLLEDVPTVGRAGDIASVSEGYARNMLFPQGKAVIASPDVQHKKAHEDVRKKAAEEAALAEVQRMAEILENKEMTMTVRVKEDTEIFGSITAKKIADELNTQAKLTLKPKNIDLKKPITETGAYKITINLSPDVSATIHLAVNAEGTKQSNAEE